MCKVVDMWNGWVFIEDDVVMLCVGDYCVKVCNVELCVDIWLMIDVFWFVGFSCNLFDNFFYEVGNCDWVVVF